MKSILEKKQLHRHRPVYGAMASSRSHRRQPEQLSKFPEASYNPKWNFLTSNIELKKFNKLLELTIQIISSLL